MIIKSPSPIGVDYIIQSFQAKLHEYLISTWAISDSDWLCYDRCYKNETIDGAIPEVYNTKGNYSEILLNDKVKVQSFFGIDSEVVYDRDEAQNEVDIHLIFMVNLAKLKATDTRPDERVRTEVQAYCNKGMFGMNLNGLQIGLEAIRADYSGFRVDKLKDMQPFHIFRLNFTLRYDFNIHNCNE
jgi:hypothetical protein